MNIEIMANYAEVIGGIAVIVSLIYVGVQIRANTTTVRSAATQSVHEAYATWYRMLACRCESYSTRHGWSARLFIPFRNR